MDSLSWNTKRPHTQCPLLLSLALVFAAPACSLITDFDQNDKPCDGYQKCEEGYYCQIQDAEKGTGICLKGTSNALRVTASLQTRSNRPDQQTHPPSDDPDRVQETVRSEDAAPGHLPCEENACLPWRGYVCDTDRQICVPQT